jgi:hypothetical protein
VGWGTSSVGSVAVSPVRALGPLLCAPRAPRSSPGFEGALTGRVSWFDARLGGGSISRGWLPSPLAVVQEADCAVDDAVADIGELQVVEAGVERDSYQGLGDGYAGLFGDDVSAWATRACGSVRGWCSCASLSMRPITIGTALLPREKIGHPKGH